MQPDFVALHNLLAYEFFPSSKDAPTPEIAPVMAGLDIGCDVSTLVVSSPDSLWFHNVDIAGNTFTRALVTNFNLSIAQAEQRKRSPETAESMSELYEVLTPLFDDLLNDVRKSLSSYAEIQPDIHVRRLLGLGGGFSLHGLYRYLQRGR